MPITYEYLNENFYVACQTYVDNINIDPNLCYLVSDSTTDFKITITKWDSSGSVSQKDQPTDLELMAYCDVKTMTIFIQTNYNFTTHTEQMAGIRKQVVEIHKKHTDEVEALRKKMIDERNAYGEMIQKLQMQLADLQVGVYKKMSKLEKSIDGVLVGSESD